MDVGWYVIKECQGVTVEFPRILTVDYTFDASQSQVYIDGVQGSQYPLSKRVGIWNFNTSLLQYQINIGRQEVEDTHTLFVLSIYLSGILPMKTESIEWSNPSPGQQLECC